MRRIGKLRLHNQHGMHSQRRPTGAELRERVNRIMRAVAARRGRNAERILARTLCAHLKIDRGLRLDAPPVNHRHAQPSAQSFCARVFQHYLEGHSDTSPGNLLRPANSHGERSYGIDGRVIGREGREVSRSEKQPASGPTDGHA